MSLSDSEFSQYEISIGGTEKGKAFLRAYCERMQADTLREIRDLLKGSLRQNGSAKPDDSDPADLTVLRQQVQMLQKSIDQIGQDICALRPHESGHDRIAAATGELDAIVTTAEQATFSILDAAEQLQMLVSEIPEGRLPNELRVRIDSRVTEILTACSFQDLTGQRTSKVIRMLQILEERVNSMVTLWGGPGTLPMPSQSNDPFDSLLNGPAPLGAVDQTDIDSILARFDEVLEA